MDTHTPNHRGDAPRDPLNTQRVPGGQHRPACPYGPGCRGTHCAGLHFDERDARMQTTEATLQTR